MTGAHLPTHVTLAAALYLAMAQVPAADLPLRQHVVIVGSSTAYPIITTAAEHFHRHGPFHAPVVESTGTGGGFKAFCSGLGLETPDIAMASRPMKAAERASCQAQGVTAIREVQIGYDGIVFANARGAPGFALRTLDLYLALAKDVPDPAGRLRLVPNPYHRWREVNPNLPDLPIRVLGPPPTSGTRDILVERVLEAACDRVTFLRALRRDAPEQYLRHCHTLREDGAYVDAGENDARLVRKLAADPGALGVLGYNYLERNADKLQAASIDAARPDLDTIQTGAYPLARPLHLYLKLAHADRVPGLPEFVAQLLAPDAVGPDGYLLDQGLIPLRTRPEQPRQTEGRPPAAGKNDRAP